MADTSYTFDAFLEHYAAMRQVLSYEHFTYAGETLDIPPEHPNPMALQLGDYMLQAHAATGQPKHFLGMFVLIMSYAQRYSAELSIPTEDIACRASIPQRLNAFRAIHQSVTTNSKSTAEQIQQIADSYDNHRSA